MNLRTVQYLLESSLSTEAEIQVDLAAAGVRRRQWLLQGLQRGYYAGGHSLTARLYDALVESAMVFGIRVGAARRYWWTVHLVGDCPHGLRYELVERAKADEVAHKLGDAARYYRAADTHNTFNAYTRVLQDKHRLKSLAAKYIDDQYRERIEPYIKRVENGKLIVRRSPGGHWSVG